MNAYVIDFDGNSRNTKESGTSQVPSMCWLIFPICLVLPSMVSKLDLHSIMLLADQFENQPSVGVPTVPRKHFEIQ